MKCTAELHIGDDYQDGVATMKCQLEDGHDGPHREEYLHDGPVVVTWVCDDGKPFPLEKFLASEMGVDGE